MTDINDLVDAFKREVAIPGAFASSFPSTADSDIVGSLMDAFGEAQIDGFFRTMSIDVDAETVTPDLSTAGAALVVIYAGMRLVRQQILNTRAKQSFVAGPVSYEVQNGASVAAELLKELERRKNAIIDNAQRGVGTSVFMIDGYRARAFNNFYGGFFQSEMSMPTEWGI